MKASTPSHGAICALSPTAEVEWTTEYVETVLLQNRTLLYGLCFLAWRGPSAITRLVALTFESLRISGKSGISGTLLPGPKWVKLDSWRYASHQPGQSRDDAKIQTRYERGSPIRGFSLGATAGSLAGQTLSEISGYWRSCTQQACSVE